MHVLFRDFSFSGDRDEVYHQLMGKEKVVQSLKEKVRLDLDLNCLLILIRSVHHIISSHLITTSHSQPHDSKGAKERNDIRELLLENFESIQVWLFKQPGTADQLLEYPELPEELIDPDFSKVCTRELIGDG